MKLERERDGPAKDGREAQQPKSTAETLQTRRDSGGYPDTEPARPSPARHGSASRFRGETGNVGMRRTNHSHRRFYATWTSRKGRRLESLLDEHEA